MTSSLKEKVHEITILVAARPDPETLGASHTFSFSFDIKIFVHGIIGSRLPSGSGFFYCPTFAT